MADRQPNATIKLITRPNNKENAQTRGPLKKTIEPTRIAPRPALHDINKGVTIKPATKTVETNNLPVIKVTEYRSPKKQQNQIPKEIPKPTQIVQSQIVKEIPKPTQIVTTDEIVKPPNVTDPDEKDNDPLEVNEYIKDIYKYWRQLEDTFRIKTDFLKGHKCTPEMRCILVNWLVEVQIDFHLDLQTLYLCISLIDRYLQKHKEVDRGTLQLLGVTSLMIACKYEEVELPSLSDFVNITDNAFSKRQILKLELQMLHSLDFSLHTPTPIQFLKRFAKIGRISSEHYVLAKYLLELSLLDHTFSSIKPSLLAAAVCCLSLTIWDEVNCPSMKWTPPLIYYSGYKYDDIKITIVKFANLLKKAPDMKRQAVQKKYSASRYHKISTNMKLKGQLIRKLTS